jgi:sortase A
LGEVAVDDQFTIEDKNNRYTYQIRKIYRVLPKELLNEIYQPVEGSWVILVTCDPVRVASHRLLVLAEVIETEPID